MSTRYNRQSGKEPPEDSTDDVNPGQPDPSLIGGNAGAPMERGPGQVSHPERPIPPTDRDRAVGSHPPGEEEEE
jgi:hypothetical protein